MGYFETLLWPSRPPTGLDAGKHLLPFYGSLTTSVMTFLPPDTHAFCGKCPESLLNGLTENDYSFLVSMLCSDMQAQWKTDIPIFLLGSLTFRFLSNGS